MRVGVGGRLGFVEKISRHGRAEFGALSGAESARGKIDSLSPLELGRQGGVVSEPAMLACVM